MDEWMFIGLFHNLPVKAPVGNNYISVAPPTDSRIEDLCSRSPAYCRLVNNFTDQFERHRQPGVLLAKKIVPYDMEGLLAFRNALAISSIIYTWENVVGHGRKLEYLKYSNYFDFYPYTLSKDEQWFIMHTASQRGLDDEAERFHGQTSPELATAELLEEFYDKRLLSSLLDKWVDRYVRRKKQDRNTAALFRSLDMAYRASVIPQLHLNEFGTNIAL